MTILVFSAMTTWRSRFEDERRLVFALVEDVAKGLDAHRGLNLEVGIARMRMTTAALDLATIYILLQRWLDVGSLNVERLQQFEAAPLLVPIGEDWFDDLCERVWARRKASEWILRFAFLESSRTDFRTVAQS